VVVALGAQRSLEIGRRVGEKDPRDVVLVYLASSQAQSLPLLLPQEMHQAFAIARAPVEGVREWVRDGWAVDGVGAMLVNEAEVGVS